MRERGGDILARGLAHRGLLSRSELLTSKPANSDGLESSPYVALPQATSAPKISISGAFALSDAAIWQQAGTKQKVNE